MSLMKLGKKAKRFDPRTFQLAKYLQRPALLAPPSEVSYVVKVPSWPMLLNDELGDCVIAAMGHMVQQWSFFATRGAGMVTMSDAEALGAYEAIGGYSPEDPSTDQGCDMLTALNFWRKNGIQVGGKTHKIVAFAEVDPTNPTEVQQAIYLFGNMFTGVQLPVSAQDADDWTVPDGGIYGSTGQPGSWGGHCIPTCASSPITKTVVTWGSRLKMSDNFLLDYCDEAYAVLSLDWIESSAPNGFNLAQLQADLAAL